MDSTILPFDKNRKKRNAKEKQLEKKASRVHPSGGNIMCRNNHHKWRIDQSQKFDTRTGKLVTVEICERCQKRRHRLT